jgi:hypothetical protein
MESQEEEIFSVSTVENRHFQDLTVSQARVARIMSLLSDQLSSD